jgi:hypothetical protein
MISIMRTVKRGAVDGLAEGALVKHEKFRDLKRTDPAWTEDDELICWVLVAAVL